MNNLVLTQRYLLLVSFDKIEYGDPYVNPCDALDITPIYLNHYEGNKMFNNHCLKIVAHRPLNGANIIPSIKLLPELKLDKPDTFPTYFSDGSYKFDEL